MPKRIPEQNFALAALSSSNIDGTPEEIANKSLEIYLSAYEKAEKFNEVLNEHNDNDNSVDYNTLVKFFK
ncbi:MAG: hypothetical protein F6I01_002305 [Aerococcus sanguinicola]|uniref:hypothetical protein n=1 Tax=Aerococcus sp. HMSC062A02 TaxID=1715105 RepID=UPI0008A49F39|nr:hypothetical protein [Aerococcus sp. HMSC062A02]OFN02603.1 hypothetical protein HMPREF2626_01435 [Aerococcus sp. HMSC062A02]